MTTVDDPNIVVNIRNIEEAADVLKFIDPCLVLCYKKTFDHSMKQALVYRLAEASAVSAATISSTNTDNNASIKMPRLVLWKCGDVPEIVCQITGGATTKELPLLIAIDRGEVCDVLYGDDAICARGDEFIRRFCQYLVPLTNNNNNNFTSRVFTPEGSDNARVDVAKLVAMGKGLMTKGEAMYAEKFFAKALGVLDAVDAEGGDDNLQGSIVLCLAWLCISQLVQNKKSAHNNDVCDRLERYEQWSCQPLSDAARAIALRQLFRYCPVMWSSTTCSVKALTEQIKLVPTDHTKRAQLIITLFLGGDVERATTEALKLHIYAQEYGAIAMDAILEFLGPHHDITLKSGWKVGKENKLKCSKRNNCKD